MQNTRQYWRMLLFFYLRIGIESQKLFLVLIEREKKTSCCGGAIFYSIFQGTCFIPFTRMSVEKSLAQRRSAPAGVP
jgi:hypothetical protein